MGIEHMTLALLVVPFCRDVQIYIQNWLLSGFPEQLFK